MSWEGRDRNLEKKLNAESVTVRYDPDHDTLRAVAVFTDARVEASAPNTVALEQRLAEKVQQMRQVVGEPEAEPEPEPDAQPETPPQ